MSRVAIFVPAYQAAAVIRSTLESIPKAVWDQVEEVFVHDNCSTDGTAAVVKRCYRELGDGKLKLFRMERNVYYGGNNKRAYRYAIRSGFDFIVMLHADGQYSPTLIPKLLEPLLRGKCEMAQGSRVGYLEGGMPFYKILANRFLTFTEEQVFGFGLAEYHSGFRAYSCKALSQLPLELLNDGHLITAEIVALFKLRRMRITDVPVPTHYGDRTSSCSVGVSIWYGIGVFKVIFHYLSARSLFPLSKLYAKPAREG